ncbi:hypothetical protein E2C01_059890 [Portunus trituberculatus]|uniref:Uncharacterized protein n=1 Tax=Portunus trituberculatus TaxID=210409 RepID=A0A5B7HAJ2_PORTR|nr:hypothetical protein [Portunus trituberculatus]
MLKLAQRPLAFVPVLEPPDGRQTIAAQGLIWHRSPSLGTVASCNAHSLAASTRGIET